MAATGNPPWHLLPIPALEAIFRQLCVSQLVQMRLMCRQWNSAICYSPKLMARFVPRFHGGRTIFRTASLDEQLGMVETSTARFPGALVDAANIGPIAVSPLWARIGQSIRSITVSCERDEQLSVAELLQMLWVLPNLRSLRLDVSSSKLKLDLINTVKLDQLERLVITSCDGRLVELFSKVCSNLKTFKNRDGLTGVKVFLPIIRANQNSLRKISLKNISMTPSTWLDQIPSSVRLQLKELSLEFNFRSDSIQKRDLVLLCKTFPAVETLKLKRAEVDSKCLEDLRKNLKQLRTLAICLKRTYTNEHSDTKVFLENSQQLESLTVDFRGDAYPYNDKEWLDLRGLSCPNLKKLSFRNFSHLGGYLNDFLKSCSNVRHLCFDEMFTWDMDSAVGALMHLKSLESLEIFINVTPDNNEEVFADFERYGTMPSVRTVRTNCFSMARCCPNAEKVELYHNFKVQYDDAILETLQALPKVAHLYISYQNSDSVDINQDLRDIAAHGKNLRKVHLLIPLNRTKKAAQDAFANALKNLADVKLEIKQLSYKF